MEAAKIRPAVKTTIRTACLFLAKNSNRQLSHPTSRAHLQWPPPPIAQHTAYRKLPRRWRWPPPRHRHRPKEKHKRKVELLLGRGDDGHIDRILCQAKKCAEKRLWRWDDSRRTNKRDVCASIQARFFYKTCYKFRVPWLVEIDLEHIIAVSTRDKL